MLHEIHEPKEEIKTDLNCLSKDVAALVEAIKISHLGNSQNSIASVKTDGGSKILWVAATICIVVACLSYQSNQFYSSQILFLQLENERQKDRNEDYFSMHMNAINQVRAKLDLKLIEPLPKKTEKETKK